MIDHHPSSQPVGRLYTDVRPTYGATATLLTEYFQASGAEQALQQARSNGWTVVSMQHDWLIVFAETPL